VRVVVLLVGLLTCAACGGGEAGEERTSGPTRFTGAGCPVEDASFCERAAEAANALVAHETDALVALSRPEAFACGELDRELFPDCNGSEDLRGFAFFTGELRFRILTEREFRSRLAGLLARVDPAYSDARGSGAVRVLGVGTCGPDDPERRSYHLAFTAGLAGERDEPAERWLGSLELVRREGEWFLSVVFADSVRAWQTEFADPFAQLACGNVQPWTRG
jgi:hypothetical protein